MSDNWYIVLELPFDPPEEDVERIARQIEKKRKQWVRRKDDPQEGPLCRERLNELPRIMRDMLGADNIRRALAGDAREQTIEPVDRNLRIIGRRGLVTAGEAENIAKLTGASLELVKRRAEAMGLDWEESAREDPREIYDRYCGEENGAGAYGEANALLRARGRDDLYGFLCEGSSRSPEDILREPSDSLLLQAEEKERRLSRSGGDPQGLRLCGFCLEVFGSEESKSAYDAWLRRQKTAAVLREAGARYESSRAPLEDRQVEEYVSRITSVVENRALAGKIFRAYCVVESIPMAEQEGEDAGRQLRCPSCGQTRAPGTKKCSCGFSFEDQERSDALCLAAEEAADRLDFPEAERCLEQAAKIREDDPQIPGVRRHLEEIKALAGTLGDDFHRAVGEKRLCRAKELLQEIGLRCSGYVDVTLEREIDAKLSLARDRLARAEAAGSPDEITELCLEACEICSDLPGVRELIPPPEGVSAFDAELDAAGGCIRLSWTGAGGKAVRYVLVRGSGELLRPEDGESLYCGDGLSFTDESPVSGREYFYNVFALRAGVYSPGAPEGSRKICALFEAKGLGTLPFDGRVRVFWDPLPEGARAELFCLPADDGVGRVAVTGESEYTVTGLRNEEKYTFRLALCYTVGGEQRRTSGITASATPQSPPRRVETLRITGMGDGRYEAFWTDPGDVHTELRASETRPTFRPGDVIPLSELDRETFCLHTRPVSPEALLPGERGAGFDMEGRSVLYLTAVSIRDGTAVPGAQRALCTGQAPTVRSAHIDEGKLCLTLTEIPGASGYRILRRFDRCPTEPEDGEAFLTLIPEELYREESAVLALPEDQTCCYTVFAEFRRGEELFFSPGAEYVFRHEQKTRLLYSVAVKKPLFGEKTIVITFEAPGQTGFALPEIEILSAVNRTPVIKKTASPFYSVPGGPVTEKAEFRIPFPDGLEKGTRIRAFFKNDADRDRYSLQLKAGSDIKIS